jgi:DNA-binding XRE family transcriptional regulator
MKKNRWNYGLLAKELKVNRITISNWDKKITAPTLYQARKLAELLGTTLDDLFVEKEKENTGE